MSIGDNVRVEKFRQSEKGIQVISIDSYQDNHDFVPTKKHILFGHHFTSISGLGPIGGPAIVAVAAGIGLGFTGKEGQFFTGVTAFNHHYADWGAIGGLGNYLRAFIRIYYESANWLLFIIGLAVFLLEIWMIIEGILVLKSVYAREEGLPEAVT
ncbi:MAG: hypothetical protein JRC68_06565 [Deltaproteobacteria bacterium]|nr:hypothetical protein [Deltaproteobacteria bacterium]